MIRRRLQHTKYNSRCLCGSKNKIHKRADRKHKR